MKTIKQILIAAAAVALLGCPLANADTHVKGHTTKKGTYVAPHQKTSPEKSKANNYSTKGNTNPHTGQKGTKK